MQVLGAAAVILLYSEHLHCRKQRKIATGI